MKKLLLAATILGAASAPAFAKYHGGFSVDDQSSGQLVAEVEIPQVCGINIQQGNAIIGVGESAEGATPLKMQIGANFHGDFVMDYDFDISNLVKANGSAVTESDIEVKFAYQQYHKHFSNGEWYSLADVKGEQTTKVNSAAYGEGYVYFRFVGNHSDWLAGTQTVNATITLDCEG